MKFDFQMTIAELVEEMNNGGSQSELYKVSKIKKDVLPYLFRVAGYTREKQKYTPTEAVQPHLTIEQLVPLAKDLQQETKLEKINKVRKEPTVVIKAEPQAVTNAGATISESMFNFVNKAEMQSAILEVLELTPDDLAALRALNGEAPTGTIYEAINKLQSRRRANKTYYLSEEVVQQVQKFTESLGLKTSQFVEVALLEAMKKYGS